MSEAAVLDWPGPHPAQPGDPRLPVPTAEMPRKGVRVARRRRLIRVAAAQHGLFTVAQAGESGLDRRARHHHLTYGNWRRTDAPDVFRLTGWTADPHERLHAWLLWAGPGSALTSWTALGLLGLTASGPRVPVDLEIRFGHDRAGQRRRDRLGRQISLDSGVPAARLHPAGPAHGLTVVDGMAVRSAAHALCAAVDHHPTSMAVSLCGHLLDRGRITESELVLAAHDMGCSRVAELLFRRWGR